MANEQTPDGLKSVKSEFYIDLNQEIWQFLGYSYGFTKLTTTKPSGNVSSDGILLMAVNKQYHIFSGVTAIWTLPVITGNTWEKLYIKNRGSGILTVNASGGTNTIYTTTAVSTFSLNPGESVILVNDSVYWSLF